MPVAYLRMLDATSIPGPAALDLDVAGKGMRETELGVVGAARSRSGFSVPPPGAIVFFNRDNINKLPPYTSPTGGKPACCRCVRI